MLKSFAPALTSRLQSFLRLITRAIWLPLFLLPFNAYALDDEGCVRGDDGQWICSGEVVVVTGTPSEPPPPSTGVDCRKNPQRCLPTNPPRPPGSGASSSDGGGRVGREIKDAETLNRAALRTMDCAELSEQEALYKAYVETAAALLASHQQSLKDAEAAIKDPRFAESELRSWADWANVLCSQYEMTKRQRLNAPKDCFERSNGKPICLSPEPSAGELNQYHGCRRASAEFSALERDLLSWKSRKMEAERWIVKMEAEVRHNRDMLKNIRAEKNRKKCSP